MVEWQVKDGVSEKISELGYMRINTCTGKPPESPDEITSMFCSFEDIKRYAGFYGIEFNGSGVHVFRGTFQEHPLPATVAEVKYFMGLGHKGLTNAEQSFMDQAAKIILGGNNGNT